VANIAATATPCTVRAAISRAGEPDSPHPAVATVNAARPGSWSRLPPRLSLSAPVRGTSPARVRENTTLDRPAGEPDLAVAVVFPARWAPVVDVATQADRVALLSTMLAEYTAPG
jgi:hypothetical protein